MVAGTRSEEGQGGLSSAHWGAGNWTTNPSTGPLCFLPSLLSEPPLGAQMLISRWEHQDPAGGSLGSTGGSWATRAKLGPRFSSSLHSQAPWAAMAPSLNSSLTKQGPKNSGLPWLKGRDPRALGVSLGQGLTLMSPGPRGSISCFSRTGKASAARTTSWWRIWGGTHRLCRSDLTTGLS